ncbi:hypothetical protein MtrunA17_Chr2g0293691 [Medicago truncatula]|uniref:Uncharacterized protein n=1 Tax=Medicago truncatula TaxID=3880 RepID=G7IL00_MEDTR|nr:hypothetical protein MTR_2g032720 [Medicago truncatula]RHN72992.1 hypothetical protein MtrunA17_Chr2g0293691 [Medicago truncatula]
MNGLRERYPTEAMSNMFIIMNETSVANFTTAYKVAVVSENNKELCICVCAMITYVSAEFQNPALTALGAIGIKPNAWRSTIDNYTRWGIQTYAGYQTMNFDWPSILVYFGCCIIVLFKEFTTEESYNIFMTNSIRELRVRAKCDPDATFGVPFDYNKATAIRTMIGGCSLLCKEAIKFLFKYMNCESSAIGPICHYLGNLLAWVDMRHLVLMNNFLIMPKSPVLEDPRVSREVENLEAAITKVMQHPYPQFFMCMVSNVERYKVEPSLFPTLLAVAQELERADYNNNVANFKSISTTDANPAIVQSLVTLHQTAFPQHGSSSSNVRRSQVKQEKPQKRSRTSNVQMPQVKRETPQNHSRTSNVQMRPVKQENRRKRSRTSNVQMPPVKQERIHVIVLD